MMKRLVLLLTGVLLISVPIPALAQGTSGMKGQVLDKDGAPMPGVTVTITNETLGVSQGAVTDSEGSFRVVPLPPGKGYVLDVRLAGVGRVRVPDIELMPNRVAHQQVVLRPEAELKERVRVTATTEVVNTEKTSTETKFSSEFIDSLPILGRNYQDVLTLAPGVSDVDGDGNPNIHGARDRDVVTLVDGVSTVDPLTGRVGQQLNMESIQEIEIKTSGASAEFSRGQGGFVNIITKSGGNDFEGSFKFYWQSNIFDGDGAGIDDPRLHGGLGEIGLRDLDFNDFSPFLSVSGPIRKDKAWYFFTAEYIQIEEPVNALTQAFVRSQKEKRIFGKVSWDVSTNHKMVFTATVDPQTFENQGINSLTALEYGFTDELGGLNLVLKETSIFNPNVFLETTMQHFTSDPERIPTLHFDTNGNGVSYAETCTDPISGESYLCLDRNGNGIVDATELDPGEDIDADGNWDVFEDTQNRNGVLDEGEDRDGDGRLTPVLCQGLQCQNIARSSACEGDNREDLDCDGRLDFLNEDVNGNGVLDQGEDLDNDFRLDRGIEDRNGDQLLNDRPVVNIATDVDAQGNLIGTYPYGRVIPIPRDRPATFDFRTFRFSGPFQRDFNGERGRNTMRMDLTVFVPEWHGQHEMKFGGKIEREHYEQETNLRPFVLDNVSPPSANLRVPTIGIQLPAQSQVFNEATSTTAAVYMHDTFKPLPNLTLNVGVRFEREATDSFGYTPFDPAAQRDLFDRITGLAGGERTLVDAISGNNDGLTSQGYCSDPLFGGFSSSDPCSFSAGNSSEPGAQVVAELQTLTQIAPSRLMQHHQSAGLIAGELEALFPEAEPKIDPVTGQKYFDRDVLLAVGGVTIQEREAFRLTNNNLAPRLGVSWDPWADSKTKLFANWARFYDKLFLGSVIPEEGPDLVNRYYLKDPRGITGSGVSNAGFGQVLTQAPPSFTQIDRGLETPFTDEFSVGFERELAPELSLRMTYIQRQGRNGLQDVDVNHEVRFGDDGKMLDVNGRLLPGSGGGIPTVQSPDGKPDLYVQNFFFNQILRLSNYNRSKYKGIEVQMTKRLSRKWQLESSYTYSRSIGDAEDFQQILGDDPATKDQEFGPLNFDQRHVVRFNAVTFLPGDWQLGSVIEWSSGLPFSTISTFFDLDNFNYPQARVLFGQIVKSDTESGGEFQPEQRNTQRNDSILTIDVHASKAFVLGRFNSKLFMDIENLLNTDDLTIFTFDPTQPNRSGNLQLISQRNFGRRFQIGFQFEF